MEIYSFLQAQNKVVSMQIDDITTFPEIIRGSKVVGVKERAPNLFSRTVAWSIQLQQTHTHTQRHRRRYCILFEVQKHEKRMQNIIHMFPPGLFPGSDHFQSPYSCLSVVNVISQTSARWLPFNSAAAQTKGIVHPVYFCVLTVAQDPYAAISS